MFSLFKRKVDTSNLLLDDGVHLTREQRDDNRATAQSNDYLRAESDSTDAMIAATHAALDAECRERGITISLQQRDEIIDARIDARIVERNEVANLASKMALEQQIRDGQRDRQMQRIADSLDDVAAEVHRSAVAANAVDLARSHPILTGFFGRLAYDKLTGQ